jgi:CubicO group peptidase (beta-lactamase class C family)
VAEFAREICDISPLFPPGTRVSYQSCGFAVLSAVVERIEGIPIRGFMREELFVPLQMTDTSLGTPEDKIPRISKIRIPDGAFQYGNRTVDWNWNSRYWWDFGAPWGGLFATVQDMTVFCQMFLQAGSRGQNQILSPTTVAAMTTNQIEAMPDIPEQSKLIHRWGLGWRLNSPNVSAFGDLLSRAAFGHTGATGTMAWVDPQYQLTCVMLTNDPQGATRLRPLVTNAVAASVLD